MQPRLPTLTESLTYTFRCELTLEQIRKRLDETGPWKWHERDNDRCGDYTSSTTISSEQYRSNVKILFDTEIHLYVVDVRFQSDQPDAQAKFETVRHTLLTSLLPAIAATALSETDTYE